MWVRPGTRVAYCSQKPWVQACSLRQNILFGRAGAEAHDEDDGHEGRAGRRRRRGGEFMASSVIEDPTRCLLAKTGGKEAWWMVRLTGGWWLV